jgi:hypothetical protein
MYKLHLETIHCIGRLNHVVWTTDTEAEAKAWVQGSADGSLTARRMPENDPIVWCPVEHCHMKRQKAVRSYREMVQKDECVWG